MNIALVSGSAGDTRCGVGDYTYELAQHIALDAEVHLYFDEHHGPAEPPFGQLTTLHLHPVKGFSVFSLNKLARELRPGARVVSCNFPLSGWKPVQILHPLPRRHGDPIYLYRFPESWTEAGGAQPAVEPSPPPFVTR